MTTDTATPSPVALDDLATWIDLHRDTTLAIAALDERRKVAREHIEAALGDAETGTVAGIPVVRWTHVTSTRLDQRKAKQLLGDRIDEAMVETVSRRFALIDPED